MELFGNIMQLDEKSKNLVRHTLSLSLKNYSSLDFLGKDKRIPAPKIVFYKALLSSDKQDLIPLFEKLKKMIPLKFNIFMSKVWKGDPEAVIRFIIEVIQSEN